MHTAVFVTGGLMVLFAGVAAIVGKPDEVIARLYLGAISAFLCAIYLKP